MNRAELRELAELYFASFGDRLEARLAVSEAQFEARMSLHQEGRRYNSDVYDIIVAALTL